jgi:hypothetical protein
MTREGVEKAAMNPGGTPSGRSGRQGTGVASRRSGISRLATGVLVLTVAATGVAAGQSLGELAKREEERRKAIKTPAKVYTNDSIRNGQVPAKPAPSSGAGGPASAPASAAGAEPPPAAAAAAAAKAAVPPVEAAEVKDEAYWRKRIQSARDQLSRSQTFADALQTRINVLSADFVARDDPAQRAVIATDRQKALAELERVKQEIGQYTKAIADIQEQARRANVPPGWLR